MKKSYPKTKSSARRQSERRPVSPEPGCIGIESAGESIFQTAGYAIIAPDVACMATKSKKIQVKSPVVQPRYAGEARHHFPSFPRPREAGTGKAGEIAAKSPSARPRSARAFLRETAAAPAFRRACPSA